MATPVIFWFRQDLRLSDHPALAAAAKAGPVIPVYILDDETPGKWRWGGASRWWLHRSLEQFTKSVPLVLRQGKAAEVLPRIAADTGAELLYFTRDYAPWSTAVEEQLKSWCDGHGVACHRYGGFLLHEPESIRNGSGQYFKVYTPFSRACFAKGEPKIPRSAEKPTWWTGNIERGSLDSFAFLPQRPNWAKSFEAEWQPGEPGARMALKTFLNDKLADYAEGRDRPDHPCTSRLSAHLHWGEISPAQVWHGVRSAMDHADGRLDQSGEKFLKELLWREFSYHLLHHFPDFPSRNFRAEFDDFPWIGNAENLQRWQRGETGYPIVDAGMRELWSTGIMHNRVRMIVASFLIKHLLIDWRQGEKWFWDTLVDADIGNNAVSWQWVAGSGADAAPYFRIFNPILQGIKFDPQGSYVRKWIPELAQVPDDLVHKPWEMPNPPKSYPAPIVNHDMARQRALAALKSSKTGETE